MINITAAELLDFLPESIKSDPEVVAMSKAISAELRAVAADVEEANILPRISDQPEEVLDVLAWDHRLNRTQLWDLANLETKRATIAGIFKWRKKSGTPAALKHFFELLGVDLRITEWFEDDPVDDPFKYRLEMLLVEDPITVDQVLAAPELYYRFSPTRSSMTELALRSEITGILTDDGAAFYPLPSAAPTAFTHMAIGDGGGAPITPDPSMTSLVNERLRMPVDSVQIVAGSPTLVHVTATFDNVPGGWTVREVALSDGIAFYLTAIASHDIEQYHPTAGEVGSLPFRIRLTLVYP